MNKPKFVNKYTNYHERQGTKQTGKELVNKEFKEDVDIYSCIEKYGVTALMRQTEASSYYYDDYNNQPKTLMEKIQQRENLNNYFKNLPARVRKEFGDSTENFYQKFKAGDFNTMLQKGILNEELTKAYTHKEETNDTNNTKQNENMAQTTTNSKSISTDTN